MKTETIRDRFAMSAMLGIMNGQVTPSQRTRKEMAILAYSIADEMMECREIDPKQLKNLTSR